jgi:hypothetical protein
MENSIINTLKSRFAILQSQPLSGGIVAKKIYASAIMEVASYPFTAILPLP